MAPLKFLQYDEMAAQLAVNDRMGYSSDITHLLGTDEEAEEYVTGLIYVASVFMIICTVWLLLIFLCCCLGPRRVGYLSGRPFRRGVHPAVAQLMIRHDANLSTAAADKEGESKKDEVNEPNKADDMEGKVNKDDSTVEEKHLENEEEGLEKEASKISKDRDGPGERENTLVKYYHEENSLDKRPTRVRLLFLLSGVIFMGFTILAVTRGLTDLQTTVNTVNYNAHSVNELAMEGNQILQAVADIRETAIRVRNQVIRELDDRNFCPSDKELSDTSTAAQILRQANDAVPLLEELKDFVSGDLDELHKATHDIQDAATTIEAETEVLDMTSWLGVIILIPYGILPAILIAATILAMYDIEYRPFARFANYVVFPCFLFIVLFACICTAAMLISASMHADFCLPGGRVEENAVDSTVYRILNVEGFHNRSFEYKVADFYISLCQSEEDPFDFLRDYTPQLTEGEDALTELYDKLTDGQALEELRSHCNREFAGIDTLIADMIRIIGVVSEAMERSLELASCENIVPIYLSVVHEGTCTYSLSAVMWVFSGFLTTAFFGLVMITFRSSFKKTDYTMPGFVPMTILDNGENRNECDVGNKEDKEDSAGNEGEGQSTSQEGTGEERSKESSHAEEEEALQKGVSEQGESWKDDEEESHSMPTSAHLLSGDMDGDVDSVSEAAESLQVHRLSI